MQSFYLPARVFFGEGCVAAKGGELSALGARAAVVTGARSAKESGALDDVLSALRGDGIPAAVIDTGRANPTMASVLETAGRIRSCGADFVVAVGGGSVLDMARAACAAATDAALSGEDLYARRFSSPLPMAAVGLSAGTGSEMDDACVITDDRGHKRSLKADFARLVFSDPRYTCTMSLRQTVSTGLDALCHCFESWLNTECAEATAVAARRGVQLVFPRLRAVAQGDFRPDDLALRSDLLLGSLYAGVAICFSGTAFPHPAGYPFTEALGVPHGAACALFEADFLRLALPAASGETRAEIDRLTGGEEAIDRVLEVFTPNDITVSDAFCRGVGERLALAKNTRRSPGFDAAMGEALVRRRFLRAGQTQDALGGWRFGE